MKCIRWIVCALAVAGLGCKGRSADEVKSAADPAVAAPEQAPAAAEEMELDRDEGGLSGLGTADFSSGLDDAKAGPKAKKDRSKRAPGKGGPGAASETEQAQARSWFPETFLFEPLVVTDDEGRASVKATVPDRLTSWRVLALAHSRSGKQAGVVTSFLGTLATYVEIVAPSKLRVGDAVELPVQVVNTTDKALVSAVEIKASNAEVTGGGAVSVAAGGSSVSYARLRATQAGEVQLLAKLSGMDSVTKSIAVVPVGRPLTRVASGTLAEPRKPALSFDGDARGSDARLLVYSGARALLSEELASAPEREGLAADAFALLLIGQAPDLLSSFGVEPDRDTLRKQRIVLTQRAVRHARVMPVSAATLLAQAADAHGSDPILSNVARRAKQMIAASQLPDGTCGGDSGWTLQRLLVSTAECALAAPDNRQVVIRASGAFERHGKLVDDPYTAAALLATKAGSPALRESWSKLVSDAVVDRPGGGKLIRLPPGVERSDGQVPSQIEATAMAVLALDDGALRNDLGASLLGAYTPGYGWGDGRANLACMRAVLDLFSEPLPAEVKIQLVRDGEIVAEGSIDPQKSSGVFALDARDASGPGARDWEVRAEPPIAGLGFALTVTSYGSWPERAKGQGAELVVTAPAGARVGRPASIEVRAMLPPDEFELGLELPAGVVPDSSPLEQLVSDGVIQSYRIGDGAVTIKGRASEPGKPFALSLRVVPTLAGRLSSGPARLEVAGEKLWAGPAAWVIAR